MDRMWTLVVLALLTACGSDRAVDVDPCPGGDLVSVDGDDYCVAEAVVIEKGFLCPEEFPNRFDYEDVVVCAGEEDVAEEKLEAVYTEYREDNPPANNGANNGVNNGCVDNDADGSCAPEDCDDDNALVGAGLPEVPANGIDDDCDGQVDEVGPVEPEPECRQDADCANGLACFDGECAARCSLDADCREDKVCRMEHCLDPPPRCESDADCPRGELCDDGTCALIDCRTDADCPQGDVCVDGTCTDR